MVPVLKTIESRGFKPLVVVHNEGPLSRYLDDRRIRYILLPSRLVKGGSIVGQVAAAVRIAPHLASFLRLHHVRIVHTNDARMHFTWGPAARLAGCKFVWHQRSVEPSRRLGFYSQLAHIVLTISDYCRQSFAAPMASRAQVLRDPFEAVPNSIDRKSARRVLAEAWGGNGEGPIIGYVGNLTAQKRPLFFLEIAAEVCKRLGDDAHFVMIGEKRPELLGAVEARLTDLDLEGHCHLLGPRYPIEPVIAALDVLVAPAKSEGLGRTLVEAMLAGTPVVATDDAGHREAIVDGETGRLAAADNLMDFANAIVSLVQDRAGRDRLTRQAMAFAKSEFSAERHLDALASLYCGLLAAT